MVQDFCSAYTVAFQETTLVLQRGYPHRLLALSFNVGPKSFGVGAEVLTNDVLHVFFAGLSDLIFCLGLQSFVAVYVLFLTRLPCFLVCSLFPADSSADWCVDPRIAVSGWSDLGWDSLLQNLLQFLLEVHPHLF